MKSFFPKEAVSERWRIGLKDLLRLFVAVWMSFAVNLPAGTNSAPGLQPLSKEKTVSESIKSGETNSPVQRVEKKAPSIEETLTEALATIKSTGANVGILSADVPLSITTNVVSLISTNETRQITDARIQMHLARSLRLAQDYALATKTLVAVLQGEIPREFKRLALFELALVASDSGQLLKSQQILAQYLQSYSEDPSIPDVLLRQGLLYRQMGVNTMAVSKFYAVMSSTLRLKLDNLDYYKKLVEMAQVEIANTYYLQGKYSEAADFFGRLAKNRTVHVDKAQVNFKLVRSLSYLPDVVECGAKAQSFLDLYPASIEVPEVRFILASALKNLGRNEDSMKQVLLLLQSQEENAKKHPETWIYWQQKAGNTVANRLYKEGDFLNALEIYLGLAELDKSPLWQVPVWYQIGLVYEQLAQPAKATEIYSQIVARQKDVDAKDASQSLLSLFDMAKWRKEYIAWTEKAHAVSKGFQRTGALSSVEIADTP